MTDFLYGSLRDDLRAADQALAAAVDAGDLLGQQKACVFALVALQRALPMGAEHPSLLRVTMALQRVTQGVADGLFDLAKPARFRPMPERQLDGLAVMFVRLFTKAGLQRGEAFARVARLFAGAGMTSHGGGRQADSDNSGISRAVTEGSIKSLWNQSRRGRRLQAVGEYADDAIDRLRAAGIAISSLDDVQRLFDGISTQQPMSVVDLLTTPRRSDTAII